MAEEYEDDFLPDFQAENLSLQHQVIKLKEQVASLESALRQERVRGRRAAAASSSSFDDRKMEESSSEETRLISILSEIQYDSIEIIGDEVANGGFGSVFRGNWQGCLVAVKRLFDPVITEELRQEFKNEATILSRLRHPNVVQYLACCSKPPYLCILTEFMARGSLYHVLYKSNVEMPVDRKYWICRQIAAGLAYMHSLDIIHNDLKALNILVDEYFRTKLGDFGLARSLSKPPGAGAGTPNYLAPELWLRKPTSKATDVYALAVLFAEIFTREVPFDGLDPLVIRERVIAGQRPALPAVSPASFPAAMKSLIEKSWSGAPEQRPTAAQIAKELQSLS